MNAHDTRALQNWPLQEHGQSLTIKGVHWYVQRLGHGPILLLLHGTGASTHSWRDLAPKLARHFDVVLCDLPGHGRTRGAPQSSMSLQGMSKHLGGLLDALDIAPEHIVGHSAGAALMCQMVLDKYVQPSKLISINGALLPFTGFAGHFFSPIAQTLATSSMLPRFVSWRAGRRSRFVDSLLADTGSLLSAEGVQYYRQLLQNPEHVAGALNMMASWQLETLTERLSSLNTPLLLLAGENDRTISPSQATLVSERVACATAERLPNVGHLAHEENPALLENAIFHWCLPTNKTRLCEATENSSNEN